MNKFLGIVLPYIMIAVVAVLNMSEVIQKEVVEAVVIGIILAIWFVSITKSEGTVFMKLGVILNIVLNIAAIVLGMVMTEIPILTDLAPILILLTCVQCAGYYFIHNNKPTLTMSYKYSYKNRRRRYF